MKEITYKELLAMYAMEVLNQSSPKIVTFQAHAHYIANGYGTIACAYREDGRLMYLVIEAEENDTDELRY